MPNLSINGAEIKPLECAVWPRGMSVTVPADERLQVGLPVRIEELPNTLCAVVWDGVIESITPNGDGTVHVSVAELS